MPIRCRTAACASAWSWNDATIKPPRGGPALRLPAPPPKYPSARRGDRLVSVSARSVPTVLPPPPRIILFLRKLPSMALRVMPARWLRLPAPRVRSLSHAPRPLPCCGRLWIYSPATPGLHVRWCGYSWSDRVPRRRGLDDRAADLYAVLRPGEVPAPYLLVGHSYGAPIIRLFAEPHPELVAGVVLVDTDERKLSFKRSFS